MFMCTASSEPEIENVRPAGVDISSDVIRPCFGDDAIRRPYSRRTRALVEHGEQFLSLYCLLFGSFSCPAPALKQENTPSTR